MTPITNEHMQNVISIVQTLLRDVEDKSAITPSLIAEKVNLALMLNPKWGEGLNRDMVSDELIRRYSLWIGSDTTLKNEAGHVSWLNSERKRDWKYWQRYHDWMERKLSWKALEALDRSTDAVLALLEDPRREGSWDRRGLVVGHVQSGKTGHYTGLICKAADAGYKIVIVLAGLHNNLRSQTQMRLDEGFLGYETKASPDDISKIIGVGEIDGDPSIRPNYVTNRSDNGDFSLAVAKNLGITPESRPWLFVVKKNKTVLERLLNWLRDHVANSRDAKGRKLVTHLPLLLIDDEADHASVDTGEQLFDADGKPDDEHEPTAINTRIRKILHSFSRAAYVGYTATPFANIFIHERGETKDEGPDLFPAAFIHSLAANSAYVGPASVFGLSTPEGRRGGLPLVRLINDQGSREQGGGWMPPKHVNGHIPLYGGADALPPSLIEAIDAFLLSCAVRRCRGQGNEHCSMLVHVTRFNSVQNEVRRQVEEHVRHVRQRLLRHIDHSQILERMHALWTSDFLPTSAAARESRQADQVPPEDPTWEDILVALPDAIADIDVRTINGTAKDALDYADRTTGLKVVAIGGDKLARGLTLEGLCVSYFLRASKMYDTLMQMGRWFGYRQGYLDLSRLYTTSELVNWFGHIADAAEELRQEFDLMASSGSTPREYGLKVQSHPVLMVTSRLKMRSAKNLMLSFSGQLLETVSLYRDPEILDRNIKATIELLSDLGEPERDPARRRGDSTHSWKGFLWGAVPADRVVAFLDGYKTHPEAYKVNSAMLSEFIRSMNAIGELTEWTVAVIGGGAGGSTSLGAAIDVAMLKRSNERPKTGGYSIGRLLSGRDEAIDLDSEAWLAALQVTVDAWKADPARAETQGKPDAPNGPAIRAIRGYGAANVAPHRERGVLLLYALDPQESEPDFPSGTPPVIAFGISFPGSASGVKVEYKVNNVLWEQEYGASD